MRLLSIKKAFDIIVDVTYDMCVYHLMQLAKDTGLTYREVNFVVFMVVLPGIILIMFSIIIFQFYYIKRLKANNKLG